MKNLKPIQYIVLLGFIIRVLFFLFGAEIYFGKKDFYIQGDTGDFFLPFYNLIEHGSFSVNLNHPDGVFGREPGYSFFLGFFYLLSGKDFVLAAKLAVYFQILLGTYMVYITYMATNNLYNNQNIAIIASLLYATYPFAFLWTSVAYAESLGIACTILSVYFSTLNSNKSKLLSGILAGIGTLIRPQLIFFTVSFLLSFLLFSFIKKQFRWLILILYITGFSISYGLWPARNFLFYKQFVLMKKVEGVTRAISSDQLSFAFFMWSVKTDWEPQISQILFKQPVEMPDWVWQLSKEDSIKLRLALALSDSCADGFRQLRKLPPLDNKSADCTEETAKLWKELRQTIIEKEPLRYYLLVPLRNVYKAFFKSALIKSFNREDKNQIIDFMSKLLFKYRSLLLLLGLSGALLSFRTYISLANLYLFFYFAILYFWLCFLYRDMDIRYLLPGDVLLLFPASYMIYKVLFFIKNRLFT